MTGSLRRSLKALKGGAISGKLDKSRRTRACKTSTLHGKEKDFGVVMEVWQVLCIGSRYRNCRREICWRWRDEMRLLPFVFR